MLGIGIAFLFILLLVVNLYIVVYFQKSRETKDNWWTKSLIIAGLQLTSFTVMMVAVDAANNGGNPQCDKGYKSDNKDLYCGDMDFMLVWQVLFMLVCIFLVVFIPFATFYWDADGDVDHKSPFSEAMWYEILLIVIILLVICPLYFFSDENLTHVPLMEYSINMEDMAFNIYSLGPDMSVLEYIKQSGSQDHTPNVALVGGGNGGIPSSFSYPVTFDIYLLSLVGWLGWFIFSIFTGTGMAAVPFDLFSAYKFRPVVLDPIELSKRKLDLQVRTSEILELSMTMKKARAAAGGVSRAASMMTDRIQVNKLTGMMHTLEEEVAQLEACQNSKESYNPLIPYVCLVFGILSLLLSLVWVLQIILYNFTHELPLLNSYLLSFDSWFPMFGVITYAIFALYALLCTIKGCFKIGMRCFCCCQIHTMALGKTEMNSFLFNLAVVMLCTTPLVHFCTQSFSGYASYTSAFFIFDVQIRNMAFYAPMFQKHVFTYIIIFMFGLTGLWLLLRPQDKDQFGKVQEGLTGTFSSSSSSSSGGKKGGKSAGGGKDSNYEMVNRS